jgi:hypothetical protein
MESENHSALRNSARDFSQSAAPLGLLIPFQAVLWTMEFQTTISFFAGIVVCALLITPFFSKGSLIALGAAAPIEKNW